MKSRVNAMKLLDFRQPIVAGLLEIIWYPKILYDLRPGKP
jgi:hypothetical protein